MEIPPEYHKRYFNSAPQNDYQEENSGFQINKLLLKGFILFIVLLCFQIPLRILGLYGQDRQTRQQTVVTQTAKSWGAPHNIVGPYMQFQSSPNYILPNTFSAAVELKSEVRQRGIYDAIIYIANVKLKGSFDNYTAKLPQEKRSQFLCIDIVDITGFLNCSCKINGQEIPSAVGTNFISINIPDNLLKTGKPLDFEISLTLRGTSSFMISPIGISNSISISGDWGSPSFCGNALPDSRNVSNKKFDAVWEKSIIEYTKNSDGYKVAKAIGNNAVGVELMQPINNYKLFDRSIGYAFFFMSVFLFSILAAECITKTPTLIAQYIISLCAPISFYLLLLSVSEQIGFAWGYLISAAAISILVSLYFGTVFAKIRIGIIFFVMMALSFGTMYIILNSENCALLVGSIITFILLAITMAMTAKINRTPQIN